MDTAIYVVVALIAGVVVGRISRRRKALLSVNVDPANKDLGNTCVSRTAADTVRWIINAPATIGLPVFQGTSPFPNPVQTTSQRVDSGALSATAVPCTIIPYTLPAPTGPYNGHIIIQK